MLNCLFCRFRRFSENIFPIGVTTMPQEKAYIDTPLDFDLKAMKLAEFEKKLALGEDDSDDYDMDDDLDNRKKGKLKRKNKMDMVKTKEKKPKLSKLHNGRFFNNQWEEEDFTKEDLKEPEPEVEEPTAVATKKVKKPVSAPTTLISDDKLPAEETPVNSTKKLKKKRKSLPAKLDETPAENGKPSKSQKMNSTFSVEDEWSKPAIFG